MNKQRRKNLAETLDMIEQILSIVETVKDEEQEAFDNMPEGIQCSERGEAMEEIIYQLEEIYDSIQSAQDQILEITEG